MTRSFVTTNHFGAEYNDKDCDTASIAIGVVNASSSTTFAATGTRSMALDMTTNGNKAYAAIMGTAASYVRMFQFALALSGTPTAELGLITDSAQGGQRHVAIGTDRKIRFYAQNGYQIGPTPSTTIPTSGSMQRFYLAVDASITLPSVYISFSFDGSTWESFDTGLTATQYISGNHIIGEYLAAGANPGVTLYVDDFTVTSLTGSDVPHTTAHPKYLIVGAVTPDSDGNYTEWTNTAGTPGAAVYTEVDDAGTHDSDTTHWASATADQRQLVKSSTANPVPGGATIDTALFKHVARLTGAAKLSHQVFLRLSGTDLDTGASGTMGFSPSTSYSGLNLSQPTKPGGGAWAQADAAANTLEWGAIADSVTPGHRVTKFFGPEWVYYTDSMSVSPRPLQPKVSVAMAGGGCGII